MHIVLLEPEIPQNTGNISRTCAATGVSLDLVHPLGFSLDDKHLKRAGLDYWEHLDVKHHENFDAFLNYYPNSKLVMATTKAKKIYTDIEYDDSTFIVFGKESKGIPEEILVNYKNTAVRIPMKHEIRSLNLSNSVAIIIFEALRQQDFNNLLKEGELHRLKWDY